ncbi:MAG TPA: hypothetical protein DCG12_02195, partial [Planctomycetaceae bacterium]|nr:hypothetical protein [Planctomycetaceae bacterium]
MYDVLAIEMSVAGRPAKDINRVLLSRVDFTGGNEAQMLVTVSVLSQFQAWKEAMDICQEIARRNPWQDAMWTMACSIADRSKNPEYILWARTGTLRFIWSPGYAQKHAAAVEVLKGLAADLDKSGKKDDAERIRSKTKEALTRDIVVSIKWAGSADLELTVTEPDGSVCSFRKKLTRNGGVLVKQGDGGQRGKEEIYVCRSALPGDYKVGIKSLIGRVIRGKVLMKVTRYAGTDREETKTAFYEVGAKD